MNAGGSDDGQRASDLASLRELGALRARAWKAVDMTSLVGEDDDEVNLALTTVAPAGIVFASRESGMNGPRLVVERDDGGSGKGKNPTTEPPPPFTP